MEKKCLLIIKYHQCCGTMYLLHLSKDIASISKEVQRSATIECTWQRTSPSSASCRRISLLLSASARLGEIRRGRGAFFAPPFILLKEIQMQHSQHSQEVNCSMLTINHGAPEAKKTYAPSMWKAPVHLFILKNHRRGGRLNGNRNYTDSVGNLITTDTTLFLLHILGVQRIK